MNVLAIETSTLTGSVALLSGEGLVGEITLSVAVKHSERLMPAIDRLFRDAGMTFDSVDLFAVAVGPGSFTGLRIGIAAAEGLASASGKPIVGVPTLEALALNGLFFPGLLVPVLNAFRGEVYRGLYRKETGRFHLEPLAEDRAVGPAALREELAGRDGPILLLGDVEAATTQNFESLPLQKAPLFLGSPRAANVAFLARQKALGGLSAEPVSPRYLRGAG